MPFDIGGTGDQGDVVQVDDLGQKTQSLVLQSGNYLASYLQMKLELWLRTSSATKPTPESRSRGIVRLYPSILRHCITLGLAKLGDLYAKRHR